MENLKFLDNKNVILFITTVVAITPTLLIKKYLADGETNIWLFVSALVGYILLALCYLKLYRHGDLSKTFTLLHVCEILLVTAVGITLFKESLTPRVIVGTLLGVTAFWLLDQ